MKILLTFIASIFATVISFAQTFTYNGINYNITGTTVEVGTNPSASGTVVIPDTVNYLGATYSVTSIGNSAFFYCTALTSITLPNSVTIIGDNAFKSCLLTSIVIPNSVTIIGNEAFRYCSALTSIDISNSLTSIGNYTFDNCTALTSIVIPNSVTSIGNYAFNFCTALTSIVIPNSVTSIGDYAFNACFALNSLVISNSLTNIGNNTFSYCYALTSIIIPNSVMSIGMFAFSYCTSLTSVIIPNSVTSIGYSAFENCTALTSITLPNSVTSIGASAFRVCNALTSIFLPNSVTSIGASAFQACTSLTSIIIPNSVTIIENSVFRDCALTSFTIPNSVINIGNDAFFNCTALTSITIPNSVTSIGNSAFYNCTSLTSLVFPNSLTSIGDYAFQECTALSIVVIDNSLPLSINSTIFAGLNVSNVGLCIPVGSVSAYQTAPIWQDFNPITENVTIVPAFDPIPAYCSGATIPALPTTSTNGVSGTWSPAINPYATTTYTFTPTSGCATAFLTITILPNYTTASLTNTGLATTSTCQGTLEATMIGGTAPYSYIFNSNPPQDSSILNNACAGFNFVTITDAVGCSADASYFLPYDSTSQPLTAYVLVSAASVTGVCDGEAEVFVTSGTAPYTFVHSTGGTSSLASGLCEGVYSVTVTDALGSTINLPYMVATDTNTLFIYQVDTSNAYNTTPVGAIENCNIDYSAIDSVTVASVTSFAVDSVTVTWNVYSGGGVLEVIPVNYYIGFGLGYYNFILDVYCPTKSNGKFLKVTAKVNVSSLVTIDEEVNFITGVYPNPFTGNLTISLSKENQYTLSMYDISGRVLFSKKYENTNLIVLSDLDYLAKGEYLLHVQSTEGVIVIKVVK
ncbi:MAG: leucine-rich repeat domain-containing protein [Fluviicola sp.]